MLTLGAAVFGLSSMFALSPQAQTAATAFTTASDAAYAAALRYNRHLLLNEIGAKIYVDYPIGNARPVYSYGPLINGQIDPQTGDEEVIYDENERDGHDKVVGLWHEHPRDDLITTLGSHEQEIRRTHQAVWTTIGDTLYVQFWNGTTVIPHWNESNALPPLCNACVGWLPGVPYPSASLALMSLTIASL